MEVIENIRTGWPRDVLPSLRRGISQYRRNSLWFKIGITNDPYRRASGYRAQYGDLYDEMIVLYETSSDNFVRQMESVLIEDYWEDCDNSVGGGGGGRGAPPYYLYIVRG